MSRLIFIEVCCDFKHYCLVMKTNFKCEANFVSSGSKIVKRLRRQKYDPVIIERTICPVIGRSTALYWSSRRLGQYMSKPPQRSYGPHPHPLCLLVGTPSVFGPKLASRRAEHSLLWRTSLYIFFDILFYQLSCLRNNFYGRSALVGCWSSVFIKRIIYKFLNMCPFDCTAFAVSWKVGIP